MEVEEKLSVQDFATKIKAKYPDYQDVPDDELVSKIIAKYPDYESQVDLKKNSISESISTESVTSSEPVQQESEPNGTSTATIPASVSRARQSIERRRQLLEQGASDIIVKEPVYQNEANQGRFKNNVSKLLNKITDIGKQNIENIYEGAKEGLTTPAPPNQVFGNIMQAWVEQAKEGKKNMLGSIGLFAEEGAKATAEQFKKNAMKLKEPQHPLAKLRDLSIGNLKLGLDAAITAGSLTPAGMAFVGSIEGLKEVGVPEETINTVMSLASTAGQKTGVLDENSPDWEKELFAIGDLMVLGGAMHMTGKTFGMLKDGIRVPEMPKDAQLEIKDAFEKVTENDIKAAATHPENLDLAKKEKEILDTSDDLAKVSDEAKPIVGQKLEQLEGEKQQLEQQEVQSQINQAHEQTINEIKSNLEQQAQRPDISDATKEVLKQSAEQIKVSEMPESAKTEVKEENIKVGDKAFLYTFNDGNFKKTEVDILPNRYIRRNGQELPIEDVGDYLLTKEDLTPEQAFEQWNPEKAGKQENIPVEEKEKISPENVALNTEFLGKGIGTALIKKEDGYYYHKDNILTKIPNQERAEKAFNESKATGDKIAETIESERKIATKKTIIPKQEFNVEFESPVTKERMSLRVVPDKGDFVSGYNLYQGDKKVGRIGRTELAGKLDNGEYKISEKSAEQPKVAPQEITPPPPEIPKEEGGTKKSLLGRVYEGKNPEEVKSAVEKHGLTYQEESHAASQQKAKAFIDDVGINSALEAVRSGEVKGGAAPFIWAESIDAIHRKMLSETDPKLKAELVKEESKLIDEFDQRMREGGREISSLQSVYQTADLGYKLGAIINRAKEANAGKEVPKEIMDKLTDLSARLDEANKKVADLEKRKFEPIIEETPLEKKVRKQRPSLSAEEVARKNELRKKYMGTLNDVTRVITQLAEKDFREYAGLVLKETAGDFRAWSIEMINTVGKGIAEHLQNLYNELGGAEIRIKTEVERLEKRLDDIRQGKIKSGTTKEKIDSPEIRKLQEEIIKAKQESGLIAAKGLPKAELTEQQKVVKRLKEQVAEYERKLSQKDFIKPKKEQTPLDKEAFELTVEKNKLKDQIDLEIERLKIKNLPFKEKLQEEFVDVMSLPKSLIASADLSAPLRQGAILSVSHPTKVPAAFTKMIRDAFSEKKSEDWLVRIKSKPEYMDLKEAGIYLREPHARVKAADEQFMSRIAEKIPIWGRVVKGSNRAYNGFLNKLSTDVFFDFREQLIKDGFKGEQFKKELKSFADFINNAQGRGKLGRFEEAAPLLNSVFFSPRYVASRFALLNPVTYIKMSPRARMEALKSMGAYIGTVTVVLAIAKAGGAQVETDPRSSDFGKIKIGNTRYDLLAGFQQIVRLLSTVATNSKKYSSGEVRELGKKFADPTRADETIRFIRTKASPTAGTAWNWMAGKDVTGKKFELTEEAKKLLIPLWIQGIDDIYKEQGLAAASAAAMASFFGVGVQNYPEKEKSTSRSTQRETRDTSR